MNELEKIREADYFLGRMTEEREIHDAFRFNLSAFLSASRSVLQYALKAARQQPGGQAWYEAHIGASKILTFFKGKRDVNIHIEPVPFRADIAVHASEQIRLSESLTIEIFEGGRLVGRHESLPGPPEQKSADEPATISTVYTFSSPRVNDVLTNAEAESQRMKDEYVSVEHLLLALASVKDGPVAEALRSAGSPGRSCSRRWWRSGAASA